MQNMKYVMKYLTLKTLDVYSMSRRRSVVSTWNTRGVFVGNYPDCCMIMIARTHISKTLRIGTVTLMSYDFLLIILFSLNLALSRKMLVMVILRSCINQSCQNKKLR